MALDFFTFAAVRQFIKWVSWPRNLKSMLFRRHSDHRDLLLAGGEENVLTVTKLCIFVSVCLSHSLHFHTGTCSGKCKMEEIRHLAVTSLGLSNPYNDDFRMQFAGKETYFFHSWPYVQIV
uniref:Uncharacterized protein n=1 Tax=Anguilla anguilla TaxID=7936 RepID=A0A0E9WX31_ANGAN